MLFPGYIFVETDDIISFIDKLPTSFFNTYMKVIGRSEERYLAVKDEELGWIRKLTSGDSLLVAMSRGIKEGGKVTFTEGPLVGMESLVKKIDRHKRTVTLEIEMFGGIQRMVVSAEIMNGAAPVNS